MTRTTIKEYYVKKFKKIALAGVLASTMFLAACGGGSNGGDDPSGAGAASGKELKLSINQTNDHPATIAFEHFAERVREETDGRINITVHPNAVLGDQNETLESIQQDVIEMGVVSATMMSNMNQDFRVLDLPLVFTDVDHQMSVLNDPEITGDLYSSLEDQNITVVGAYTQGQRNVYNNRGPIVTPDDMQGLKVRVQETDVQIQMIEAMGGVASPMAFGEVYSALQTGVIDGAENNLVSYTTQKHNEVAKYYSYTGHLFGADMFIMSTSVYESWSEEDQEIWREQYLKFVEEFNTLWEEAEQASIEEAEAGGSEFNEVDKAAFEEVLKPVAENALETDTQRELYEAFTSGS